MNNPEETRITSAPAAHTEPAEEDPLAIQRLLAWYFRPEDPSRIRLASRLHDAG
jgi:hypothetical protein